jgi:flavodoxin
MANEQENARVADPSRRAVLKVAVAGLIAGASAPLASGLASARAAEASSGGAKVLIVYFSRSGNTREIAWQIRERVGGDIVELRTVAPYPEEYDAVTRQAKQELNSGFNPPLKTRVENVGEHDVVLVGSPNWWGTVAGPVRTFLSQHDLSGKKIAPFITHEGSGLGRSTRDIATFCPGATVLDGLAVRGGSVKTAQNEVAGWLRRIGMEKV